MESFLRTTLGNTGFSIHRVGLSATYRPGKKTIYEALDQGLNYFFCFGIDTQMISVLREIDNSKRENYIFASGAGNLIITYQNLRKSLERRLRQLKTEYLDIFYFLGVTKEKEFPERAREEMLSFKEEGKVRAIGMSCHDRPFAGKKAAENALDVLMVRYNAAHRGAEQDIFPHLEKHNPGVVSFTATRWRYLLKRPRGWSESEQLPSTGMAYRFVLSNPHVHVCMMAPSNKKQFINNLAEIKKGKLTAEENAFMLKFGDTVYR